MDGMRYPITVNLHGTLSANAQGYFTVPAGMTLVEVSGCGRTSAEATLQIGTSADLDGIMTAAAIGVSGTPVVFTPADFDGDLADEVNPYHLVNDTIFYWLLTHNSAVDVMIVFTFLEG